MPLAHAYRLSGRRELGRRTAFSALRGHAWSALLQSDPSQVSTAARHAAEDAVDIARWCLMDGDAAAAATALDAGRGLMLYAATETRDLAAQLVDRGEHQLAQQWQQALAVAGPTEAPTELRRRVISAVAGIPLDEDGTMLATPVEGAARLLDPPTLDEVRAALSALEADALVYLVPGDGKSGAAVLVPADEEPTWLMLPELSTHGGEFERLVAGMAEEARRSRRARDSETARDLHSRSGRTLDAVCDWAWRVAIGPLLERGVRRTDGRPPRLVLVPMRELALVPWHAASRPGPTGPRYAIEDAVFSYAASARLLCNSAWAPEVTLSDGGLVVGDPDTGDAAMDLPAARSEALAIQSAYYPAARYVGRAADSAPSLVGAGTYRDVVEWLADPAGGAVLHLACHGVVQTGTGTDGTSYLLLAGGRHLAADDLLRASTTDRGHPIGLAVLAACRSAAPARGYDEAFSLSTAFLAGEIRSVISAQWSVPDAPTSVLMFMFHHYLRRCGLRPVDALRAAQLWMISEKPEPPDTMPDGLRRYVPTGRSADVAAWAGFVHSGR